MGFNPRYSRWTIENWAGYAPTVGAILEKRCHVDASCPTCRNDFKVRLKVIARTMGPGYSLWGSRPPCPLLKCQGRLVFRFYPPRPEFGSFWMLAVDDQAG